LPALSNPKARPASSGAAFSWLLWGFHQNEQTFEHAEAIASIVERLEKRSPGSWLVGFWFEAAGAPSDNFSAT